ncbi:hypothetical protein [Stieleria varia]|nr:hypothetical protein [Stieleria varia]
MEENVDEAVAFVQLSHPQNAEITQPRRWSFVVPNDNTRGLGESTLIIAA